MRVTRRVDWRDLAAHGALMLCLGLAACTLASFMATPAFAQIGYSIAVVLSALCLLISGSYFGVTVYRERYDIRIFNYLMIGVLSICVWSAIWLIRSAPTDLCLLSLIAGMHGAVWSLWYVRLAFHLKTSSEKAALLSVVAATTSFLGIVLSTQTQPSRLSAVAVVAYFSLFIGIQILLITMYLYRELEMKIEGLSYTGFGGLGPRAAINSRASAVQPIVTQPSLEESPIRATAN